MRQTFSLTELADSTGIEARTIRSYIERGLLPNADTRGRGASYSEEHLARLRVIQSLRRARRNIALGDIRILLQQFTPEQIRGLAHGSITASVNPINESSIEHDDELTGDEEDGSNEFPRAIDWAVSAKRLTGVERLVSLFREISGRRSSAPQSKFEGWQRISVTPDVELSIRSDFDANQLASFRELADLLRHLLQQPDALHGQGDA